MRSTNEITKQQAPAWLNDTVYEPKRQRTFELVKQAVDALIKQREQDGSTRVSLNSIVATAKHLDPAGQGIAHTSILENEEAYAYYKRFRTASTPKKRQSAHRNGDPAPVIKADRDQARVRQRYRKLSREELVGQLLSVERQYAELHERYLAVNDKLLEWQLRAEATEAQLKTQQEQLKRSSPSSPKQK